MTDSKSMQTRFSKKDPNDLLAQLGPNEDSIQELDVEFLLLEAASMQLEGMVRPTISPKNNATNKSSEEP